MTTETEYEILGPRETGHFIAENSDEIKLIERAVERVADKIFNTELKGQSHCYEFNAQEVHLSTESVGTAIDWIFLIDTINFSFWADDFIVTYKGKQHTGYFAACACVNKAMDEGIPMTNATFMSNVDEETLRKVFRTDSGTTIPLLEQRHKVINEAGRILKKKFYGTFHTCVQQCGRNAQKLLSIILQNFPSYRDYAEFKGKRVSFLKRAQILISDIHSCLGEKTAICNFTNIKTLTMFADYRVPQVLVYLGVLKYSENIMNVLRKEELIENGSEYEVIIRGFSIYACEKIAKKIQEFCEKHKEQTGQSLRDISEVDVDMFLWSYRRKHAEDIEAAHIPYHRVRCIYY